MAYSLSISKEAELDINATFEYYEGIRDGLGHDFLLCVEEALEKISATPEIYKTLHENLKRIPIRRFSHRVFCFVIHGE